MWKVYILQCLDESFYTGVTQDIERRIREHNTNNKLGSKFVRSRRPAKLVYFEETTSKSKALKRENEIKSWSREKKFTLIKMGQIRLSKTKKNLVLSPPKADEGRIAQR